MKIVLDEQDIIALVKDSFEGVTEVSFNKTKVSLNVTVDSKSFKKKKLVAKNTETMHVGFNDVVVTEDKNLEAKKKGAMASGGRDRFIAKVG